MNEIFTRTSIRAYKEEQVEDKKIKLLMKAAMAAPSAGNQQPWEFYVVKNRKKLEELSLTSPFAGCTKSAPMAIVVCYRQDCRMLDYAQIDSSIASENILLEAESLGLGAVWLGIAPLQERMQKVEEVLQMPQNLHAFAIIPVGYPVEKKPQQDRYDVKRVHVVEE